MEEKRLKDYLNLLTESGLLTEHNLGSSHEEKNVRYVSYNSMDVKPGTLFICKGKAFKAQYLQDAIDKGAFCYVGETKIEGIEKDFPYILVNDIRTAMSEIGGLFYDEIWNKSLAMVGITGTKGKSTTATFVKAILDDYCRSLGEREAGFISGIYTYDGRVKKKAHITTPETLELHKMLSDCAENGCKYLVMETSSQALKYGRTAALDYTVSAFLNISEDHISDMEHPDFEDYFDSKLKIFRQSKIACVNMDMESERCERVLKAAKEHCQKVITFGSNVDSHDLVNVPETADFYGYDIKATSSKLEFKLKHQQQTEQITVNIGGKYNVSNALAAVAIARALDIPFKNIKSGLSKVKVAGRMELYALSKKHVDVIVDYAHNKLSYQTLLENVRDLYPNKKIMLIAGCVGGKAQNRRQELADVINTYVDEAILTEQYPGKEPVEKICAQIKANIKKDKSIRVIVNRDKAVEEACRQADDGWVIVAAGSDEDRDRVEAFIKNNE